MYCTNCGSELPEGQNSCPNCQVSILPKEEEQTANVVTGTENGEAVRPSSVDATAFATSESSGSSGSSEPIDPSGSISEAPNLAKTRNTRALAFGLLVVLAIIAVFAVVFTYIHLSNEEKMRLPHNVRLIVEVPEWENADTLVPVEVKGTDLDGQNIDQLCFIDPSDAHVSLTKGTYTLSFPASPLTQDGIIYTVPENTIELTVPNDLEPGSDMEASGTSTAAFAKLTALKESGDLIDKAYDFATKCEGQESKAVKLKEVAISVHDKAVAAEKKRIEAEKKRKAAKAKAAALAAKKAAGRYFTCPYYTINLPDNSFSGYTIKSQATGMSYPDSDYGIGWNTLITSGPYSSSAEVCVFTSNWGPQGDFTVKDLGISSDGYRVCLFKAREDYALSLEKLAKYITVK